MWFRHRSAKAQSRPCAFFSFKTQFENAGDALINRELLRLCALHSDVYLDLSRCPGEFAESLGVSRFASGAKLVGTFRLFLTMVLSRVAGRDAYYFVSPGGYLGEKNGVAAAVAVVNSVILGCLGSIGVRVCHVGVSFERIGSLHRRILRWRTSFMFRVLVRDFESFEYAQSIGVRVDGVAPDLAFGAAHYRPWDRAGNALAISFRADQLDSQRSDFEALVRRLNECLPMTVEFRFIAQVERDVRFLKQVADGLSGSARRVTFRDVHNRVDLALDAYAGCRTVVSNRLHSLLFGFLSGAAPVPIVHPHVNEKVLGLFHSIGVPVSAADDCVPRILVAHELGEGPLRELLQTQLELLSRAISGVFNGGEMDMPAGCGAREIISGRGVPY